MGNGVGGGDEDGVWCVDRNAEGRIGWERGDEGGVVFMGGKMV